MDSTSDRRFDPNFATQILLDLSHEHSLEKLLQKLVDRAMERHLACVQVWLMEKGDLCATCPSRPECPDQSRCLHLAAAKAHSILGPGKGFGQFDPGSSRIPLGAPPIGILVAQGQGRDVQNLDVAPVSPLDPAWMREEGVRAYAISPICYKGEPLGAIVAATREAPEAQLRPWGPIFANHIGSAIANARAFDEIQRLKGQLELHNAYLQEAVIEAKAFGDLVGQSAALRHIIGQIDLVAPTEASVLILGETGAGKELVARAIRARSRRAERPFMRVNCGSIAPELVDSELFGHERGSFTGAVAQRKGWFERADGGTLLLDEIGELSLAGQARLLRVLETSSFAPAGAAGPVKVDVRLMAATSRDLAQEVARGAFRRDLFHRLHVMDVQLPPLRERRVDVPVLVRAFLEEIAARQELPIPELEPEVMGALAAYDYPGNLRELQHVLERAVALAQGGPLRLEHLPAELSAVAAHAQRTDPAVAATLRPLGEAVAAFERAYIQRALDQTGGHRTRAAALLGISRKSLWERLRDATRAPPGDADPDESGEA